MCRICYISAWDKNSVKQEPWEGQTGEYTNEMDVLRASNSESTGITVEEMAPEYRKGDETRARNMNVVYLIRVW